MKKYTNQRRSIKVDNIDIAYQIAAQVVALYGDSYLPIFKRLHEEIQTKKRDTSLKSLALEIAIL